MAPPKPNEQYRPFARPITSAAARNTLKLWRVPRLPNVIIRKCLRQISGEDTRSLIHLFGRTAPTQSRNRNVGLLWSDAINRIVMPAFGAAGRASGRAHHNEIADDGGNRKENRDDHCVAGPFASGAEPMENDSRRLRSGGKQACGLKDQAGHEAIERGPMNSPPGCGLCLSSRI